MHVTESDLCYTTFLCLWELPPGFLFSLCKRERAKPQNEARDDSKRIYFNNLGKYSSLCPSCRHVDNLLKFEHYKIEGINLEANKNYLLINSGFP